jgi:catechol 2,3-dioxygenase-like lactoylglutathione lyase family enzyme
MNHIATMVPNIDDAVAWYTTHLHFVVADRWDDPVTGMEWAHLQLDDLLFELVHRPGMSAPPPGTSGLHHFGITVDDCVRFTSELEAGGVEVVIAPSYFGRHHIDWAFVKDHLGNIIEIVSYREADDAQDPASPLSSQPSGDRS